AARLTEEVERARQRVQQSHESVETYLQTAIDTMNLLQAYIAQAQATDRTRSAAVLNTLSGYVNLTMQNLTAAHRHQSALSQPLGALNENQTRLDQAQIEARYALLALLSDLATRPDAPSANLISSADLDICSHRTTRHALHRIHFSPRALASSLTGNSLTGSVHEEQVCVSDERGIQGRLEGRAGTVLGAVFRAPNQDLKLGSLRVLSRRIKDTLSP
ncbi:hypothetical protein N7465_000455, partial [Penicillium sp. CMV-2018d]